VSQIRHGDTHGDSKVSPRCPPVTCVVCRRAGAWRSDDRVFLDTGWRGNDRHARVSTSDHDPEVQARAAARVWLFACFRRSRHDRQGRQPPAVGRMQRTIGTRPRPLPTLRAHYRGSPGKRMAFLRLFECDGGIMSSSWSLRTTMPAAMCWVSANDRIAASLKSALAANG
jgi:hypothetical protein